MSTIGATSARRAGFVVVVEVRGDDVGEALEDAPDDVLLLRREVAAGAVGDGVEPGSRTVARSISCGRRADQRRELVGDHAAVLLARRALTARLDREEPGDARRDRGEVGRVVEDDEPRGAEPGARRPRTPRRRAGGRGPRGAAARSTRRSSPPATRADVDAADGLEHLAQRRTHRELADAVPRRGAADGAHDRARRARRCRPSGTTRRPRR